MKYPKVPLGEVLELDLDQVEVEPFATYPMAGVYSFGKGLFAREPIRGTETSYKKLTRLHEGQFVYSRLFAWEGAAAVVIPEFDGRFVSHEFPTFRIDPNRATPGYMKHIARWPEFHKSLAGSTRGLGLRRQRVHPEQLLAIEIPLPDLDEQRRIATMLDALIEKSRRVQRLHETAVALSRASSNALVVENAPRVPIGDLVRQVKRVVPVEPTEQYRLLGMRWYADGLFLKDIKPGIEISAKHLYRVETGDFIYNRLFAWKGSFGIAQEQHDGAFVSGEFPCFEVAADRILPEYLLAIFTKPKTWEAVLGNSRGSTPTSRNRLREEQFLEMLVPVPSLEAQRRIVRRIRRLEDAAQAQRRREPELSALEPSILNHAFNGQI